ncbi:unnamed protein product [Caenorhabditis nigoni]
MPIRRVAKALKNANSHQGTSKGINSKRRRLSNSFESESEQDVQVQFFLSSLAIHSIVFFTDGQMTPRKTAQEFHLYSRNVPSENDYDFEESSIQKETEKGTVGSKK